MDLGAGRQDTYYSINAFNDADTVVPARIITRLDKELFSNMGIGRAVSTAVTRIRVPTDNIPLLPYGVPFKEWAVAVSQNGGAMTMAYVFQGNEVTSNVYSTLGFQEGGYQRGHLLNSFNFRGDQAAYADSYTGTTFVQCPTMLSFFLFYSHEDPDGNIYLVKINRNTDDDAEPPTVIYTTGGFIATVAMDPFTASFTAVYAVSTDPGVNLAARPFTFGGSDHAPIWSASAAYSLDGLVTPTALYYGARPGDGYVYIGTPENTVYRFPITASMSTTPTLCTLPTGVHSTAVRSVPTVGGGSPAKLAIINYTNEPLPSYNELMVGITLSGMTVGAPYRAIYNDALQTVPSWNIFNIPSLEVGGLMQYAAPLVKGNPYTPTPPTDLMMLVDNGSQLEVWESSTQVLTTQDAFYVSQLTPFALATAYAPVGATIPLYSLHLADSTSGNWYWSTPMICVKAWRPNPIPHDTSPLYPYGSAAYVSNAPTPLWSGGYFTDALGVSPVVATSSQIGNGIFVSADRSELVVTNDYSAHAGFFEETMIGNMLFNWAPHPLTPATGMPAPACTSVLSSSTTTCSEAPMLATNSFFTSSTYEVAGTLPTNAGQSATFNSWFQCALSPHTLWTTITGSGSPIETMPHPFPRYPLVIYKNKLILPVNGVATFYPTPVAPGSVRNNCGLMSLLLDGDFANEFTLMGSGSPNAITVFEAPTGSYNEASTAGIVTGLTLTTNTDGSWLMCSMFNSLFPTYGHIVTMMDPDTLTQISANAFIIGGTPIGAYPRPGKVYVIGYDHNGANPTDLIVLAVTELLLQNSDAVSCFPTGGTLQRYDAINDNFSAMRAPSGGGASVALPSVHSHLNQTAVSTATNAGGTVDIVPIPDQQGRSSIFLCVHNNSATLDTGTSQATMSLTNPFSAFRVYTATPTSDYTVAAVTVTCDVSHVTFPTYIMASFMEYADTNGYGLPILALHTISFDYPPGTGNFTYKTYYATVEVNWVVGTPSIDIIFMTASSYSHTGTPATTLNGLRPFDFGMHSPCARVTIGRKSVNANTDLTHTHVHTNTGLSPGAAGDSLITNSFTGHPLIQSAPTINYTMALPATSGGTVTWVGEPFSSLPTFPGEDEYTRAVLTASFTPVTPPAGPPVFALSEFTPGTTMTTALNTTPLSLDDEPIDIAGLSDSGYPLITNNTSTLYMVNTGTSTVSAYIKDDDPSATMSHITGYHMNPPSTVSNPVVAPIMSIQEFANLVTAAFATAVSKAGWVGGETQAPVLQYDASTHLFSLLLPTSYGATTGTTYQVFLNDELQAMLAFPTSPVTPVDGVMTPSISFNGLSFYQLLTARPFAPSPSYTVTQERRTIGRIWDIARIFVVGDGMPVRGNLEGSNRSIQCITDIFPDVDTITPHNALIYVPFFDRWYPLQQSGHLQSFTLSLMYQTRRGDTFPINISGGDFWGVLLVFRMQ